MAVSQTVSLRAARVRDEVAPGALLFGAAIPILFLHIKYQPGVRVPFGSTHLGLELSDVAVVVVGAAALLAGRRVGFARLRPGLPVWIAAAGLLIWILVRTQNLEHAVTAAKLEASVATLPAAKFKSEQVEPLDFEALNVNVWNAGNVFH